MLPMSNPTASNQAKLGGQRVENKRGIMSWCYRTESLQTIRGPQMHLPRDTVRMAWALSRGVALHKYHKDHHVPASFATIYQREA